MRKEKCSLPASTSKQQKKQKQISNSNLGLNSIQYKMYYHHYWHTCFTHIALYSKLVSPVDFSRIYQCLELLTRLKMGWYAYSRRYDNIIWSPFHNQFVTDYD